MKISATACVLAMAVALPAFAQKVSVEYAHQADFAKFQTYKWAKNKGELPDKEEDAHIKNKLDRVLQAKGLRKVDSGITDLVVTYQATVQAQQEVDTYGDDGDMGMGMGWGMGWGWGWGDMGPDYSSTTVNTIRKGDLLVDIANPATKKMLYRGYATGAFHSNPIKEDKLLSKAIDKMFKNFPPKEK